MWYAELFFPFLTLEFGFHFSMSVLIAFLGLFLILISSITFYRYGTTLNPLRPELTSALVTSGPYRYSRNPIYVGLALMLLGWGVYLQNLASLFCVLVFVLYINRFQIFPEEESLAQKFGVEFEIYKSRVNRWL
jgi:protein-S-isoprenylcysteine O-methyltransferase Ste14